MFAKKISLYSSILMLTGACASMSTYQFSENEPTAELHHVGIGIISFYKDGQLFTTGKGFDTNTYLLPAGSRIKIVNKARFESYTMTVSCSPSVSFVPVKGKEYITNSFLKGEKCYLELAKVDKSKKTGLDFEYSLGRY